MGVRKNGHGLRFPCECVSVQRGYSDPWAAIAQNKLLNDGTKERILNLVARQPRTIAHLANELGLSQPSVHAHVGDLLKSELLREAAQWQKTHPAENYYEPAFPVITGKDHAMFEPICQELAQEVARLFQTKRGELETAIKKSGLAAKGWTFDDVAQYCFAEIQRSARKLLEQRGTLRSAKSHKNGVEWVFWALDPVAKTDKYLADCRIAKSAPPK